MPEARDGLLSGVLNNPDGALLDGLGHSGDPLLVVSMTLVLSMRLPSGIHNEPFLCYPVLLVSSRLE